VIPPLFSLLFYLFSQSISPSLSLSLHIIILSPRFHILLIHFLQALNHSVKAVVIASGYKIDVIKELMEGRLIGTIFVANPPEEEVEEKEDISSSLSSLPASSTSSPPLLDSAVMERYKKMAQETRMASRILQSQLTSADRSRILLAIASSLEKHQTLILEANAKDLQVQTSSSSSPPSSLTSRLVLTEQKLVTLISGIRTIGDEMEDPIGKVLSRTEVSEGLLLQKEQV
jgi:hypothetical protein